MSNDGKHDDGGLKETGKVFLFVRSKIWGALMLAAEKEWDADWQ